MDQPFLTMANVAFFYSRQPVIVVTAVSSDYLNGQYARKKYTLVIMKRSVTEVLIKGFSNYGSAQ